MLWHGGRADEPALLVQQGGLRKAYGLTHSGDRNSSAPAYLADELPRFAFGDVVQHLKNHDTSAFKRRLAMANPGISNDKLAELSARLHQITVQPCQCASQVRKYASMT